MCGFAGVAAAAASSAGFAAASSAVCAAVSSAVCAAASARGDMHDGAAAGIVLRAASPAAGIVLRVASPAAGLQQGSVVSTAACFVAGLLGVVASNPVAELVPAFAPAGAVVFAPNAAVPAVGGDGFVRRARVELRLYDDALRLCDEALRLCVLGAGSSSSCEHSNSSPVGVIVGVIIAGMTIVQYTM